MKRMLEPEVSALALVERLAQRYADLPIEAIFKEDLLRRGMAWSEEAPRSGGEL